MDLHFASPAWALALPIALATVVAARRLRRRAYLAANFGALGIELPRPSRWRRLPAALLTGSLSLLAAALMDPVASVGQAEVVSHGIDIAIVLDLSSSMQETMGLQPPQMNLSALVPGHAPPPGSGVVRAKGRSRLEVTRDVLREFVRRRDEDRVGLVVFSDNAYVVSPLTVDHESLLHYIDMVDEKILQGEGMTAIGEGLSVANQLLDKQRGSQRRRQVILLLTDGEHNHGREPFGPLDDARAAGVKVHLIGIDLEQDIKEKESVKALLAAVQERGGRYLEADDEQALFAASRELDGLEKGPLTTRLYQRDVPAFRGFALSALVLSLGAVALLAVPYFTDVT